jgi:hypothetical protein
MEIDGVNFSLYQPDIFSYLKDGQRTDGIEISGEEWFRTAIAFAYEQIADSYGCKVHLSAARTDEARLFWMRDVGRIDLDGDTTPDHFKQAGFLAYWLRRRVSLNHVIRQEFGSVERTLQTRFVMSGNELCAFIVGFRICVFFVYGRLAEEVESLEQFIDSVILDDALVFDVAALMKNKNVSPHALYALYRALFHDLKRPPRANLVSIVGMRGAE